MSFGVSIVSKFKCSLADYSHKWTVYWWSVHIMYIVSDYGLFWVSAVVINGAENRLVLVILLYSQYLYILLSIFDPYSGFDFYIFVRRSLFLDSGICTDLLCGRSFSILVFILIKCVMAVRFHVSFFCKRVLRRKPRFVCAVIVHQSLFWLYISVNYDHLW